MDSVSKVRLSLVHPDLAKKITAMVDALAVRGIDVRVVQGYRSKATQDALYAQGRTAPGPEVTNAPGGHSYHEFGLAVDCMPGVRGVTPWKMNGVASHPDYAAMIAAGEAQGLVSGSHWVHIKDYPHFQLAGIPVSPTDDMRAALTQGTNNVWNKFVPH
jgi:peptidoglycan L-alanyl-D-glutamate endopeptidase CwlK